MALVSARVTAALAAIGMLATAGCEADRASGPTAARESAPLVGGAVGFDVGPIRTAAEYRSDADFASADAARGKLLSLACAACHTFGAGEGALVGPNLHGVFGRPAGTVPGFTYSPGLMALGLVWTPRALDAWLTAPQTFVVGTTMGFTGYRAEKDRRDLIAYLLEATR
jgi:cytochrome c